MDRKQVFHEQKDFEISVCWETRDREIVWIIMLFHLMTSSVCHPEKEELGQTTHTHTCFPTHWQGHRVQLHPVMSSSTHRFKNDHMTWSFLNIILHYTYLIFINIWCPLVLNQAMTAFLPQTRGQIWKMKWTLELNVVWPILKMIWYCNV